MNVNLLSSYLDDLKKQGLGDREVVLCVLGCVAEVLVIQSNPSKDDPVILIGAGDA